MHVRVTRVAALIAGIALAGTLAAGCGKYSISNIRSLKAFQDANTLYKRREYAAAIERYQDAVRFNPELGFAYFFLGNSYDNLYKPTKKDDPENVANLHKAVENYRIAIDKMQNVTEPKEKEIRKYSYEYLIAAYGSDKLNDFSKAEPIARELIALEPREAYNYHLLGRLYEEQGMYEQAEEQFRKAIDLNPNDPAGYQMLAGFYNRQGEFEKTMEAFRERANREPNNPEAWHTIGTYYQDKVFRDKGISKVKGREYTLLGIEAEDKALELNPEFYEALIFKNILLRQQALFETNPAVQKQLTEQAIALYNKAEEIKKKQTAAGTTDPAAGRGGGQGRQGGSGR
jgi:tetratricopeptide (TPR) repeat protein